MKYINVEVFVTKEGSNKVTEIPLDPRAGLYYKIVTDTFETPFFSKDAYNVPVRMFHDDRSPLNVNVVVKNDTLEVSQIYQQSERLLLITAANDDWTDTSELRSVYIAAMNIDTVTMENGTKQNVVASYSNGQVLLQIPDKSSGTVYSHELTTTDGHKYVKTIGWSAHNAGSGTNPQIDFHTASASIAFNVFSR